MQHIGDEQDRMRRSIIRKARTSSRYRLGDEEKTGAVGKASDLPDDLSRGAEGGIDCPQGARMSAIRQEKARQGKVFGKPAGRIRPEKAEGNARLAGATQRDQAVGYLLETGIVAFAERIHVVAEHAGICEKPVVGKQDRTCNVSG